MVMAYNTKQAKFHVHVICPIMKRNSLWMHLNLASAQLCKKKKMAVDAHCIMVKSYE